MARDLSYTVDIFARLLYVLIFIRVVLQLIGFNRRNAFVDTVYSLTEPLLAPVRALLRKSPLGAPGVAVDLSPFALYLLIYMARNIIISFIS